MLKHVSSIILASGLLLAAGAANAQIKPVGQAVIPPGSPYSAGVLANGTLYVSGLQGVDPSTHKLPADFETEVKTASGELIARVRKQLYVRRKRIETPSAAQRPATAG